MIKKKAWHPAVTSQFAVCTIPFHMDTYRGCSYNCAYCFARDFTTFARRNSANKEFTYLECNDPASFKRWVDRTLKADINYDKAEQVAFKERMPLKIGATADPFPPVEKTERVTYDILKTLHEIDYPVQMSTKNPQILASYSEDFKNPNWIVSVSIVTINEEYAKVIEPGAVSPERRFLGIEKLAQQGINVLVRIQPTIYPNIMDELPQMVKRIFDSGAKGFLMEGLKLRVTMPKHEQEIFRKIGDFHGYDIRQWYKDNGTLTGSDWEIPDHYKMDYISLAQELARTFSLKFYCADNIQKKCGDSAECCGTEYLRDYNIFAGTFRNKIFDNTNQGNCCVHFPKCRVNFVRSKNFKHLTVEEAADLKNSQVKKEPVKKASAKPALTPAEEAKGRTPDYHSLSPRDQWAQDKRLGILDWDGK